MPTRILTFSDDWIPVGAGYADVPEVGRQQRHLAPGAIALLVPPRQRLNGEAMPKVMQPRPLGRTHRTQARLARQRVEGSMDMTAVEASTAPRDEQIAGDRVTEELRASLDVIGQDRVGRRMDRHQPPLAELGATNRQNRLLEVDVGKLEIQCFGQSHARYTEQAEQTVKRPRAQRCRRPDHRKFQRRIQQPPDLVLGIQVWSGARGMVWQ